MTVTSAVDVVKQVKRSFGWWNGLGKHWAFAAGFSGTAVVACAYWRSRRLKDGAAAGRWRKELQDRIAMLRWKRDKGEDTVLEKIEAEIRVRWARLDPSGAHVMPAILALNGLTLLAWRFGAAVPRFGAVMNRYFTSSFQNHRVTQHLFTMFSHQGILHLGFNMVALSSFYSALLGALSPEEFLAVYLCSGVWAGVLARTSMWYLPSVAAHLSPSIGASHAVLAMFAILSQTNPDARMSLIFLPMFSFSASQALFGIIALDTFGLLVWRRFGSSMFDHLSHLTGVTCGLAYAGYGKSVVWNPAMQTIYTIFPERKPDPFSRMFPPRY